jgi:hypothetical protein
MAAYKMAAVKVTPPNDFPLGLIRSHMVVIHLFLMLCDLQRVVRDLCPTLYNNINAAPIPLPARSKAWKCGHLLAGIAGLNPAGVMAVSLWGALCVVRNSYLCWVDQSSRGVLPHSFVSECDHETSITRKPWPNRGLSRHGKLYRSHIRHLQTLI